MYPYQLRRFPPICEGYRAGVRFPLLAGGTLRLIRVHRLSSLCARRARFFALTPSPSPTGWERGVGAHGGAPCSAFPLSRRRERGTKGVRAIQRTCRFTLALGKIALAAAILCRTVVPLSDLQEGVRNSSPRFASWGVHSLLQTPNAPHHTGRGRRRTAKGRKEEKRPPLPQTAGERGLG